MPIDIDAVNLNITITEKDHLTFDGHYIRVDDEDGLSLWCTACGHSASFDRTADGLHMWEAVCYLLNDFDDSCDGDGKDLEERVRNVMNKYVGEPADQGHLAAMEHDIRDVVGDDIPVNINA